MPILTRRAKASGYFKVAFLLALGFASNAAYAVNCYPDTTGANPPLVATATLAGSITPGRDIPDGTVIYQATFNGSPTYYYSRCDYGTTTYQREFNLPTPHPKSTFDAGGTFGQNVYETNVPGVGVVVWWAGQPVPTVQPFLSSPDGANVAGPNRWFDVSFIKIGPIGAGRITAADIPWFNFTIGDNRLLIEQGRFTGGVNIVARTCTTPDVNVHLGDFTLDVLKGVGSTTPEVEVPIVLRNCPAFFGKFHRDRTTDTGVTRTRTDENIIEYQIDPTSAVLVSGAGVVALKSGGARGMGVQVKDTNKAPLTFGRLYNPGLALTTVDGADYRISLWANYYQVFGTTTPGRADATVTMTLVYQ